jgi:hypothetical protein
MRIDIGGIGRLLKSWRAARKRVGIENELWLARLELVESQAALASQEKRKIGRRWNDRRILEEYESNVDQARRKIESLERQLEIKDLLAA